MSSKSREKGMSLIELIIVIGILGVLFAAVFMFFTKGTEQFHFARRQNELATQGRLALEMLSDEIRWAGYMPAGGWSEDDWHPVESGDENTFEFYFDADGDKILQDEDHRNIFLGVDNILRITDEGTMQRVAGTNISSIQFNYFDAEGNPLAKPLDIVDRDAVRHIGIKLTLQSTYMGDVYQTVMQTVVTPRNLGVQHNFDPLFYMPPEPVGEIVVNVKEDTLLNLHEEALVDKLIDWGHTVTILEDSDLPGYPYDSLDIDLVILRNIENPVGPAGHFMDSLALQALPVPVIVLDPDDACMVFHMADSSYSVINSTCPMLKVIENHTIHDHVPLVNPSGLSFSIYDGTNPTAEVTVIDSLYATASAELVTAFTGTGVDTLSGVSVINEFFPSSRRVHYCAPEFAYYSADGDAFLRDVIKWGFGYQSGGPDLGEEIEGEDFEGDNLGEVDITIWEDDLEGGVLLPDSIPIYGDFEPSGTPGLAWTFSSTGSGAVTRLGNNTLQMERTVAGAFDRNIAVASLDLSAYSMITDDLYITVETNKGTSETINAEDGVFLVSIGGSIDTLVNEDFESLILGNGDVEFWGDLYGRNRVHSPGWNNGTSFVTLDSRVNGNMARVRMMIEVDTSILADGTPITVNYRMSDHGDETHNYNSGSKSGDYIAWSTGNDISNPVYDVVNLAPGSKSNGVWNEYQYTFTPPGVMPSTVYVIFAQYDNYRATSATGTDGISFDDVRIEADNTTLNLDRVGVPSASLDWQPIAVDLDDEAAVYGVPFSADFGVALSQYGLGPWSSYGMQWRNFEVGVIEEVYTLPGWSHGPFVAGETDDWLLEDVGGDHRWTMHANGSSYSHNCYCWLQTPEFTIPSGATEANLAITHEMVLESGYDYAWIEVSTNGGATWQFFDTTEYNTGTAGHDAFSGTIPASILNLDLMAYAGQTISLRFVLQTDGSVSYSGWVLDDFEATATLTGIAIESIGFKPTVTGGSWFFDFVDVWLGVTPDAGFSGDGEWSKASLTHMGTFPVMAPATAEWVTIDLPELFILSESENLLVKLEMNQVSPFAGYEWVADTCSAGSRWATSAVSDPTFLTVSDVKPAFMVSILDTGNRYVNESGGTPSTVMPLAFGSFYGDFEAIYTLDELGFTGEVPWVHGGTNDDWEIGAPIFLDVDPALEASHGNNIAGNDLTDDGYYNADSWCWIRSGAYDIAEVAVYDSVALAYDRCLRRAFNDFARIQIAFTDTADPPVLESQWMTVRICDFYDNDWVTDVLDLTDEFNEAIGLGRNYYFVRFLMDSGPFGEDGGWNIDNVGFYGRYAI